MSRNEKNISLTQVSAKEIENYLKTRPALNIEEIELLKNDSRKSVREQVERYLRRQRKDSLEMERVEQMRNRERRIYEDGYKLIAGVDEVGRGPLAGPVVAAAVILDQKKDIISLGIKDSKQLLPDSRERLFKVIMKEAICVGIGMVEADEIDKLNILQASLLAMSKAVEQLTVAPQYVLCDGSAALSLNIPCEAVKGGDASCLSIAAASIVAKVTRDRLMDKYAEQYPVYGFAEHKGYPTPKHREALKACGLSPLHRRSFRLF